MSLVAMLGVGVCLNLNHQSRGQERAYLQVTTLLLCCKEEVKSMSLVGLLGPETLCSVGLK